MNLKFLRGTGFFIIIEQLLRTVVSNSADTLQFLSYSHNLGFSSRLLS